MPRHSYVWDSEQGKLLDKAEYYRRKYEEGEHLRSERGFPMIAKDIQPFRSPVDGSEIIGRRSLREHNRRNDVVDTREFEDHWEKCAKDREAFFNGTSDKEGRINDIIETIDEAQSRS